MNWTPDEIRQLRYRLGWSQAEMARSLKLELGLVTRWEAGHVVPQEDERNSLLQIFHLAESNAESVQRRPIADVMMRDLGLSQIHNFDVHTEPKKGN